MYRRLAAPIAVGTALLLAPAAAGAAVTVGSALQGAATTSLYCTSPICTESQDSFPSGDRAAGGQTAPAAGVAVRWRVKVGDTTGPIAFRVIRPGLSSSATGGGTGPTVTPPINTTATYAIRLPVRANDGVGLNVTTAFPKVAVADNNVIHWTWEQPGPLDDDAPARSANSFTGGAMLVNMDVEPDADGDVLGDESQDNCVGVANAGQADFNHDGKGDVCQDTDGDGVLDSADDCATVANPSQANAGGGDARGDACDDKAPTFIQAVINHKTWAVDPKGKTETPVLASAKKKKAAKGAAFVYYLTEASAVTFKIDRALPGRKVGKSCKKPTKRNRGKRKCTRYKVFGRFVAQGAAGKNTKKWSGKIGAKKLSAGPYRATLTARDGIGNKSKVKRIGFTIVRR